MAIHPSLQLKLLISKRIRNESKKIFIVPLSVTRNIMIRKYSKITDIQDINTFSTNVAHENVMIKSSDSLSKC